MIGGVRACSLCYKKGQSCFVLLRVFPPVGLFVFDYRWLRSLFLSLSPPLEKKIG
jgi:hypothetical protein